MHLRVLGIAVGIFWLHGLANPVEAQISRKYAVLIGVNDYDEASGFKNLKFAERDVDELAEVLEKNGYRIKALLKSSVRGSEPTHDNIRDAVTDLSKIVMDKNDLVLVAFSGHGVQLDGTPCFCPKDCRYLRDVSAGKDPLEVKRLVSLQWVRDQLESLPAGVKVLLCDACRDDPIQAAAKGKLHGAKTFEHKAAFVAKPPDAAKGFAGLFSCEADQIAYENDTIEHSWFYHHVIEGFRGNADAAPRDGKLEIFELSEYVKKEVSSSLGGEGREQKPELVAKIGETLPLAVYPDRLVDWKPEAPKQMQDSWKLNEIETVEGRRYLSRFDRTINNPESGETLAATFILVADRDERPLYIMKNKVSRKLFYCFAKRNPAEVAQNSVWTQKLKNGLAAGERLLPAFNVTQHEAAAFAKWLGGRLPDDDQWDAAAGYLEWKRNQKKPADAGPFVAGKKPDVAAIAQAPRPVGRSKDDVSEWGVCDMAGNGYEWTATQFGGNFIHVRGQNFQDAPLTFAEMLDRRPYAQPANQASEFIGFRCVIVPRMADDED